MLSDTDINRLADAIVLRSAKLSKTESEKELRNTKYLLKNYRLLANHSKIDIPKLEDDVPLSKYELSLYSLLGYRARSKEMIEFINQILEEYRHVCTSGSYEQNRRYEVISNLYINKSAVNRSKLAKRFNVDEQTIYRDERKAIDELSIMLFGIDALNDMSK